MIHYLFRTVKVCGPVSPNWNLSNSTIDYIPSSNFNYSNEYVFQLETEDVPTLQSIAATLFTAEACLFNAYECKFCSIWRLTVGEEVTLETPCLVVFPMRWGGQGLGRYVSLYATPTLDPVWYRPNHIRADQKDPIGYIAQDERCNNPYNRARSVDPWLGVTVRRDCALGRARHNTYMNCLGSDDFFWDESGILRLIQGGPFISYRFPQFSQVMANLIPYFSPVFLRAGVPTMGSPVVSTFAVVGATEFKARRTAWNNNKYSKRDKEYLIHTFLFDIQTGYIPLVLQSQQQRGGFQFEPETGVHSDYRISLFFSFFLNHLQKFRQALTSAVYAQPIQKSNPVIPQFDRLSTKYVQHSTDKKGGIYWTINILGDFINYLSKFNLDTYSYNYEISHVNSDAYSVLQVMQGTYVSRKDSKTAKVINAILDNTELQWQQLKEKGVEAILTCQRATNIIAVFEKFADMVEADLTQFPARPRKKAPNPAGKTYPARTEKARHGHIVFSDPSYYGQIVIYDRQKPITTFNRLPPAFVTNPNYKAKLPQNEGALWLASAYPLVFDASPFTGVDRVRAEVPKPPPPPPAPKPKRTFVWDNTIHPLTPEEAAEDRCAQQEYQEELTRKLLHPAMQLFFIVEQLDGQIPTGTQGNIINAELHALVDLFCNSINDCDDPYEHVAENILRATPSGSLFLIKKFLTDRGYQVPPGW